MKSVKERLIEELYGKGALRDIEREKELAHARQLADIRLEAERRLAEIRRGEGVPPAEQPNSEAETPPSRRAFVEPILAAKGWSILDWANEAGVAYHTAADYLAGITHPYRSTRAKLCKVLGVSIQRLPE